MKGIQIDFEPSNDLTSKYTLNSLPVGYQVTNKTVMPNVNGSITAWLTALVALYPSLSFLTGATQRSYVIDGNIKGQTYINQLNKNAFEFYQEVFNTPPPNVKNLNFIVVTVTFENTHSTGYQITQNLTSQIIVFLY
jgi:hypothetical protein